MAELTDLDLLLIGKTGNGKSHTGNSILKRRAFVFKNSTDSVTKEMNYEVSEYKGRIIKVVDGPGVGDTSLENEGAVKLVVKAMEDAIKMNTRGYHAFLLVVRFGGRFTKEDTDTVQLLKDIFGNDFVKKFCILVMTCGDNFEHESEETGETFQQWCKGQKGVFKQLLDECQGRAVLFNNVTKNEAKKDAQNDRLLKLVDGLASQGHRYCDKHFQRANEARQKAIVESKIPVLREEIMQEASLILQKLEKLRGDEEPEKQIKKLKLLLKQADVLFKKIKDEDKGTGALHEIEENVKAVQTSVAEAINVHETVNKERAALKQQEIEMEKNMKKQIEEEKQKFQKMMDDEKKSWEEIRKQEKAEEEKRRAEEAKKRKEFEEREKKLLKELEKEQEKLKQQAAEIDRVRREIKKRSNKNWFQRLLGAIGIRI